MATAKLKTGETIELPFDELCQLTMQNPDSLETYQSQRPRLKRRSQKVPAQSVVQDNF